MFARKILFDKRAVVFYLFISCFFSQLTLSSVSGTLQQRLLQFRGRGSHHLFGRGALSKIVDIRVVQWSSLGEWVRNLLFNLCERMKY